VRERRERIKTNFLRRRPSVHRASSSLTTWVQKCGFSRWNNAVAAAATVVYITVVARYRSNLRDPKNRVIYFLRTAGYNLTEKSIPASATERCGLDGVQVVSVWQLTAILNTLGNTHTPGHHIIPGVLKIANKSFDENCRLGRGRTSRKDFVVRWKEERRWPRGRVRVAARIRGHRVGHRWE